MRSKSALRNIATIISLIGVFTLAFVPSKVLAASNISLTPATGSYSSNFNVLVNVNTNGDATGGISLRVNYTGPVSYVSGSAGNIAGCTPTYSTGTGYVDIECLISVNVGTFTGSGNLATLVFAPSGSGTATLSISAVTVGGSTQGTISGATYTITTTGTGTGTGTGTTNLPQTSIFSENTYVVVGMFMLFLSIFLYSKGFGVSKVLFAKKRVGDSISESLPEIFR